MSELEKKVAEKLKHAFPMITNYNWRSNNNDEEMTKVAKQIIPIVTDSIRPNLGENEELAVVEKESELPKYSYKWARKNFNHSGDEYVKAQQDIIDNGFKKVVRIIGGCP